MADEQEYCLVASACWRQLRWIILICFCFFFSFFHQRCSDQVAQYDWISTSGNNCVPVWRTSSSYWEISDSSLDATHIALDQTFVACWWWFWPLSLFLLSSGANVFPVSTASSIWGLILDHTSRDRWTRRLPVLREWPGQSGIHPCSSKCWVCALLSRAANSSRLKDPVD